MKGFFQWREAIQTLAELAAFFSSPLSRKLLSLAPCVSVHKQEVGGRQLRRCIPGDAPAPGCSRRWMLGRAEMGGTIEEKSLLVWDGPCCPRHRDAIFALRWA